MRAGPERSAFQCPPAELGDRDDDGGFPDTLL